MKKILLSLTIMTLLVSCGESEEKTDQSENREETEELISEEETEEVAANRIDNLCMETTNSDCYVVDFFSGKDADYITVDFVNYKVIETDSEPEYELVNEIKTLRTFIVDSEYFDCARSEKKVSTELLFHKSENDPETLFNIDTDDGKVIELFVRNCAG